MSKAFTRESDEVPERPVPPRKAPLPPGAKNYMTADGARRLNEELELLVQKERAGAAPSIEHGDAQRPFLASHHRMHLLQEILDSAVIVPPPIAPENRVVFGATVTVRESSGAESRYRIVGVDETDIDRGWVSWLSPLAKALLNARLGERIRFKTPLGEEELEIVDINYGLGLDNL